MAKYVKVKEAPKELDKHCYVIDAPNFTAEITKTARKKSRSGLMTPNFLREIFASIGDQYLPETFNAISAINVSKYKGLPADSIESIENIVNKVVREQYPVLIDAFVDKKIKSRPHGTKLIYFLGNFKETSAFSENGIDEIAEKEVDVYLGKKKKKIFGKPAITDEEAKIKKK